METFCELGVKLRDKYLDALEDTLVPDPFTRDQILETFHNARTEFHFHHEHCAACNVAQAGDDGAKKHNARSWAA